MTVWKDGEEEYSGYISGNGKEQTAFNKLTYKSLKKEIETYLDNHFQK